MDFLKNPRSAPAGNRTLWLVVWMFELAAIFGGISLLCGYFLMAKWDKSAADVAILVGAVGAITGIFGERAMKIYLEKSKHRAEGGKDAPEPPANGTP